MIGKKAIKIIFVFVVFLFMYSLSYSQIVPKRLNDEYYIPTKYYFGLCLVTGAHSQPVTYAIIKETNETDIEAKIVSRETFLRMITGNQECKANPKNEDFLEINEIDPLIFKEIWKLKYSEHPNYGNNEKGWAGKLYNPTDGQHNLLNQYGIYTLTNYCYGENMFKLLKDLHSINWVNLYKGL